VNTGIYGEKYKVITTRKTKQKYEKCGVATDNTII
jgi:hypothetical protein